MTPKILHILNGDATLAIFQQSNIEGRAEVMRETFCFWPLQPITHPEFWENRLPYFSKYYQVSKQEYLSLVMPAFDSIKKEWDEICVWYEYDVYCQINMLFTVAFCHRYSTTKISLVFSEIGMGREESSAYPKLFDQRITLEAKEINYCNQLWEGLVKKDFSDVQLIDNPRFPNLKNALQAFQNQFWQQNERPIEFLILDFLKEGVKSGKEIVRHLLLTDTIYGLGDLQYLLILHSMHGTLDFLKVETGPQFFDQLLEAQFSIKKKS